MTHMFGKDVVSSTHDSAAVSYEVRDGLHDVPRVLPPREARQEAELYPHVGEPRVHEDGGAPLSRSRQLGALLWERNC